MPSVSENITPPDCSGPFAPLPPFQCLQALGGTHFFDETAFYTEMFQQQTFIGGFGNAPSTSGQRVSSNLYRTFHYFSK